MGLLAFRGTVYSDYITSLQATFAEFGQHLHSTVRYEMLPTIARAKSPSGVSSLTSFAASLMSPVITLSAGTEPTELHIHEALLCRLPFFRAALKGDFKEASEQVVKMPEDDVTSIGALIEFLSTGGYTYAYNPDNTRFRDRKSLVPIADLEQGLFHVSVYATASKYDCQNLIDEAVNNFRVVVGELEGIDVLRLWQAAYGVGLTMSAWGTGEGPAKFSGGLMKWGAMLSEKHREEMERILCEYPALACDLLGFSNTSDRE
ncbi:hypothetical protein DFP73DRAFT_205084 [Morchella snyderi]|nr:hypothetical protein DFP73DRAFT_205084 [Morchella snyderi]